MRVDVLLFGVLQDVCGGSQRVCELADGACVRDAVACVRGGLAGGVWEVMAVAVNREYAALGTALRDGDEVALLPPVSGGAQEVHNFGGVGTQVSEARPGAPVFVTLGIMSSEIVTLGFVEGRDAG